MAPNANNNHEEVNIDVQNDPNGPSYAEQLLYHQKFKFQVRRGKLDLLKLMKVDLDAITRDTDIDTLQSFLENTAFCNLTVDELRLYSPDSLHRLFVVLQLTTEYLLNVQNTLAVNINALARKYSVKKREVEDLKDQLKSKDDYIASCLKKETELRGRLQHNIVDEEIGAPANDVTPLSSNQRNQKISRSASSVEKSKTIAHLQEQAMELATSALKSQKEFERITKLLREDIENARIRENNAREELDKVRQSLTEAVRSEVRSELQAHRHRTQIPSDTVEDEIDYERSYNIHDIVPDRSSPNESIHTIKPFNERLNSLNGAAEIEAAQALSAMKAKILSYEDHQVCQRDQEGEEKEQSPPEMNEEIGKEYDNDSPSSKLIGSDIIASEEESKLCDNLHEWRVSRLSRDSEDTFQRDRMYTLSSTATDDTFNKLWTDDNDSLKETVNETSSMDGQCAGSSYSSIIDTNNFPESVDDCVQPETAAPFSSSTKSVGKCDEKAAKVDNHQFTLYHENLDSTIDENEESKVVELSEWVLDEESGNEQNGNDEDGFAESSSNEIALISGLPTTTPTPKKRGAKMLRKLTTIKKMIARKKYDDNQSRSRGW
eukprot:CAMPEP_0116023774 /NCGR_PEP_ID=MMETSP0321-20121206/11848_1 /TAXON_ID=163516 /ORGANISM="Leptocylindrus danicus var. danicus, Strain B650" /LENGTH=603 /DNA_ID=CAMNT_0003495231 /DNA_START=376 /DNA_END=2184 /DNA_ORIENTATION=+